MSVQLLIGAASEVITPEIGCEMAGFDARNGRAERLHDDLHARALVLDDSSTKAALVSVELLGIEGAFCDDVRKEIAVRTGIPAANVLIAATHTHCGPATFNHFYNQGQPLDQAYLKKLSAQIVAAVENAKASAKPRKLRSGMVPVNGIAVNRRTADGQPIDPLAGVLAVEELDGTTVAVAISFACHTTVLGPNTLDISGDFPHYTIRKIQETLGAQVEVLYFNGAEGDLSVGHKSDLSAVGVIAPFRTFGKAEELGNRLAHSILDALTILEPEQPALQVENRKIQLPLKTYAQVPEMQARRQQAIRELQVREATASGANEISEELLRARQRSLFARIEAYYAELAERAEGFEPKTLSAEVTGLRIGKTVLLSFPGEVFVEIALAIRERSPFPRTIFIGLANDYIGYVPTPQADTMAGYEVVAARVTSGAAGILIEGCLELMDALAVNSDNLTVQHA